MTTVVTVLHQFCQMLSLGQKDMGTNGCPVLGALFVPNPANKNKMKTIMPCPLASDEMRRGSLLSLPLFRAPG